MKQLERDSNPWPRGWAALASWEIHTVSRNHGWMYDIIFIYLNREVCRPQWKWLDQAWNFSGFFLLHHNLPRRRSENFCFRNRCFLGPQKGQHLLPYHCFLVGGHYCSLVGGHHCSLVGGRPLKCYYAPKNQFSFSFGFQNPTVSVLRFKPWFKRNTC